MQSRSIVHVVIACFLIALYARSVEAVEPTGDRPNNGAQDGGEVVGEPVAAANVADGKAKDQESRQHKFAVGDLAPVLEIEEWLPGVDGVAAAPESGQGKVIVLEFWSTWCAPCIEGIPRLNELADGMGDRARFIAITSEDDRETVASFLRRKPIHASVGMDSNKSVYRDFGVRGIPHTVIIRPDGRLAAWGHIDDVTLEMLEKVAAGEEIPQLPSMEDAGYIRAGEDPNGELSDGSELLKVVVRPTRGHERMWVQSPRGTTALNVPARSLVLSAYGFRESRCEIRATLPDISYDFILTTATPLEHEAKSLFLRVALENNLRVVGRRETRKGPVLCLKWTDAARERLQATVSTGGAGMTGRAGEAEMINVGLDHVASALEGTLKRPVLDETNVEDKFDLHLKWDPKNPLSIINAVRTQLGLEVEEAEREIEYFVIENRGDSDSAADAVTPSRQEMLTLPVRVVDADGNPVSKAKITPWALRCSQGHGLWRKDDERAGVDPEDVFTDKDGTAEVLYPLYRDVQEQIGTISVSLFVDHPDFAYTDGLHIDVPLETNEPYEVKLTAGVPLEIRPLIESKPADLDNIFAMWSDGRSWRNSTSLKKTADGVLRIPAMPPGKNSVLLVKLDGDRATHFSKITDIELKAGERNSIDVELRPSLRIQGVLSDNVPRPVRQGRIKTSTLHPAKAENNRVEWFSWVPIQADGTFTIDGWPPEEKLQLIALCEGFIATSGKAPDVVEQPRDFKEDPFNRPQVFDPAQEERIEVVMSPLVPCIATAVDEDDAPIAGVQVTSWPNVGWWNQGSQIYCHPLVRGERLLRERDYNAALDEAFATPFQGTTDAHGKVTIELPAGDVQLAVVSDVYELPAFLGRRAFRVKLVQGQTTEAILRLQPRGTEKLGEWDKLAGVVFGCSTREGRQICALPGVQKQMDEFAERFREAKNQRDPKLLSEAYSVVADAFANVGDDDEAAKWRQKAADQAAKVKETE